MNRKLPNWSKASLFDLDHTLLKGNGSYHFGSYLYEQSKISRVKLPFLLGSYGLHKASLLSIPQMQQMIFSLLFKGKASQEFENLAGKFVAQFFDRLVNPLIFDRLKAAQREGQFTALLSSSPDFLVRIFAERFQVDVCFATTYAQDEIGCFSTVSRMMLGEDKAAFVGELIEQGIARDSMTAYSDSVHDLVFLRAVGNPVGVNPDRKLRRICLQNRWAIVEET